MSKNSVLFANGMFIGMLVGSLFDRGVVSSCVGSGDSTFQPVIFALWVGIAVTTVALIVLKYND